MRGSGYGRDGMLLLDPSDIEIVNGAGAGFTGSPNFEGNADNATIVIDDINAALGGADVQILTDSGFEGLGNITWSATDAIVGNDANSLSLLGTGGEGNITFSTAVNFGTWTGDFIATANGSITVNANIDRSANGGNINFTAGADGSDGSILLNSLIHSGTGNLTLTAQTGICLLYTSPSPRD